MMQMQQRVQWSAHSWAPYASELGPSRAPARGMEKLQCPCRALYVASWTLCAPAKLGQSWQMAAGCRA